MDDKTIFNRSKEVWEKNLKLFPESKLNFPDENLVRLYSGKYSPVPLPPARIMDHGFGHGNNLVFLADRGYECYGCEISDFLIEEVNDLFAAMQYACELRPVRGLEVPFDDDFFDIVLSWNTLHYNGEKSAVLAVISEMHRVLKPGGVLLLSTIHPDNGITDRMTPLGGGSYLIEAESDYDNREGLTFFMVSDEDELRVIFQIFKEIKIGRTFFDLFNTEKRHATFLVYGIK